MIDVNKLNSVLLSIRNTYYLSDTEITDIIENYCSCKMFPVLELTNDAGVIMQTWYMIDDLFVCVFRATIEGTRYRRVMGEPFIIDALVHYIHGHRMTSFNWIFV